MGTFTKGEIVGPPLTIEKLRQDIQKLREHKLPLLKISTGSLAAFSAWADRHIKAVTAEAFDSRAIAGYLYRPLLGVDVVVVEGMSPMQAVLTEDGVVRGIINLAE